MNRNPNNLDRILWSQKLMEIIVAVKGLRHVEYMNLYVKGLRDVISV